MAYHFRGQLDVVTISYRLRVAARSFIQDIYYKRFTIPNISNHPLISGIFDNVSIAISHLNLVNHNFIKVTKKVSQLFMDTLILIAAAYVGISLFFFIFPTLIYPKKKYQSPLLQKLLRTRKILRMAHRGGPRYGTENTIQLFSQTEKVTDCFEMDVCETADKILVVHHDHHLSRTCGVDQDVEDYNFTDLPEFAAEIPLDFGVRLKIKSKKQKIPKLEDVFKRFPDTLMNIELKTPTDSAMIEFTRMLKEHNRVNNTIIGVRNHRNAQLNTKHPEILTFMNDTKVFKLALAYFLGFAPFLQIKETSLQIPVYSSQFQQWHVGRTPKQSKWKARLFMRMIKCINIVTVPLLWHLKRRGILSLAWVCNTREAFDNAVRGGFQGIMTDDPFLLDIYLKQKDLHV